MAWRNIVICNLNDVACMKKEMCVILAVFCLFSCKSGKQAERTLAVDSLAVSHRHSREERWNFDSLARSLRIVLDSVEVFCLADTVERMPRKGGVVMRARRAEVVRGETLVECRAQSRQETDNVYGNKAAFIEKRASSRRYGGCSCCGYMPCVQLRINVVRT
jgi:hypothetical protein